MKKKYRNITVESKLYAWNVKSNVDGDGTNLIKIWFNKKVVYENLIPWKTEITPKLIRNTIIDNKL